MLSAFNENLVFFYSPMQVQAQEAPKGRTFRMGGMVMPGSVKRLEDGVTVSFGITDTGAVLPAQFKGILPDYMPPEAQDAVDKAHAAMRTADYKNAEEGVSMAHSKQ